MCGKCLIIFVTIFFSACASKDVARKAYNQGDYNTSNAIWQRWVDVGYLDKNVKIINALEKSGDAVDYKQMEKMALDAYNNGEEQAAFLLENIYISQNNLQKAYLWMQKGDLALSSQKDFENHLYLIKNYLHTFSKQKNYLEKIESFAQNNNLNASYALGKFYAEADNPFLNLKRSRYFYKKAYELGNSDAGLALANLYIYHFNSPNEGIDILQELVQKGNGKAASQIGDYILSKADAVLAQQNTPCIATSFQKPEEFYINTLSLEKTKHMYIKKGVVPWYQKAYELHYIDAKYKLIGLDLKENNFDNSTNFSQMDKQEIESFLNAHQENPKAKSLLATLYSQYPGLGKSNIAESIYFQNMDTNITDAQWKLYNFYKKNKATSSIADEYLQELAENNFPPAITILQYQNILGNKNRNHNFNALLQKAKKGDRQALSYLISLHRQGLIQDIDISKYFEQACKVMPNSRSLNMTISDYYLHNNQFDKGATILHYYAQQNNPQAQYKLAKLYKEHCNEKKMAYWLQEAYKNGNEQADIEYISMIIEGLVKGDSVQAIQKLKNYAKKGNLKAMQRLADSYADGTVVDFNPKIAQQYYQQMIKNGDTSAYLRIAALYSKINDNHQYDKKLENAYLTAIQNNVPHAKIRYASYLIKQENISRAKNILKSISADEEPYAKILLSRITGKEFYTQSAKPTNNGYLLLHYAQQEAKHSKKKALLYAFRAHLCNTPSSGKLTINLMRLINNSHTIANIYAQAKSYPQCTK